VPTKATEVTRLLRDWRAGDEEALERLLPRVYDELRRLARAYLARERPGHTLQPTALVHEAYLRLVDQTRVDWQNRAHFFAIAATSMRRILVSHARRRHAAKRGGAALTLTLDEGLAAAGERDVDLVALDEALAALERLDPRQARIVELRFFAGLTIEETATALEVSPATVKLDWKLARAWLFRELSGS
jgi:RNA polymerase sigma factor (TIGR02999 family)